MREYTNSEIRFVIAEWIHSERDRKILYRRLIDGLTIEKNCPKSLTVLRGRCRELSIDCRP